MLTNLVQFLYLVYGSTRSAIELLAGWLFCTLSQIQKVFKLKCLTCFGTMPTKYLPVREEHVERWSPMPATHAAILGRRTAIDLAIKNRSDTSSRAEALIDGKRSIVVPHPTATAQYSWSWLYTAAVKRLQRKESHARAAFQQLYSG